MPARALLLYPPTDLSACLFAAVVRDTRGIVLSDPDRFNFFPASPLVSVTLVVEGEVRMAPPGGGAETARAAAPLARSSALPPQETPTVSWCPGPALVVTVGVYPDAWARLAGHCDLPAALARAMEGGDDVHAAWARFSAILSPIWAAVRGDPGLPGGIGAARLSDWSRALVTRAAQTGAGRGVHSVERRLKRWSGQTRRSLRFYAAIDDLRRIASQAQGRPPADIALEAGYADQSHMGWAVRRATGFSPVQLNRLIETEEAFWFYRLTGAQV